MYAKQKGASDEAIEILEKGMKNIASLSPDIDIKMISGSGAAGGFSGGLHLFLGAKIVSAQDLLFEDVNLSKAVNEADYVITGEGKIDAQTHQGKLVSSILQLSSCKKFILVAGQIKGEHLWDNVIFSTSLMQVGMSEQESMKNARSLLLKKGEEVVVYLKSKMRV